MAIRRRSIPPPREAASDEEWADYNLRVRIEDLRVQNQLSDERLADTAQVAIGTISNFFKPGWKRTAATFYPVLNALHPDPEQFKQAVELYEATQPPANAAAAAVQRRDLARSIGITTHPLTEFTPLHAEVHTAIGRQRLPATAAEHPDLIPPPYVPRDYDPHLNRLVEHAANRQIRGIILLRGTSSTGKTRSLYEATHRLGAAWTVHIPTDAAALSALPEHPELLERPTILWLNELQRFITPGRAGLTIPLLENIYTAATAPLVIVATIWPDKTPQPGDDQHHAAVRLLDPQHGWTHPVDVPTRFTTSEHARARNLESPDPRLTRALQDPDHVGTTQTLAGAGELLHFYKHAAGTTVQHLLDAAADARRLGHNQPLTTPLLKQMTLTLWKQANGPRAPQPNWFTQALTTATKPIRSDNGPQPLIPLTNDTTDETIGYTLPDYLEQWLTQQRALQHVPDQHWEALLANLDQTTSSGVSTLNSLAWAARARGRFAQAERLYRRAFPADPQSRSDLIQWLSQIPGRERDVEMAFQDAVDAGDYDARRELAEWLARVGRRDEAITAFRQAAEESEDDCRPLRSAAAWLGLWRRDSEAEALFLEASAGGAHQEALVDMGWWLDGIPARRSEAERAFRAAVQGDGCAGGWPALLQWLALQDGRAEDYIAALKAAVAANESSLQLAEWLAEAGLHRDAEQIFRREAAGGNNEAAIKFALWLESCGREDEGERVLRSAAKSSPVGAQAFAQFLAKRPDRLSDLERHLRANVDVGRTWAVRQLVPLLTTQGRIAEAEETLRRAVSNGFPSAPTLLAEWLSGQQDRRLDADTAWHNAADVDPLNAALAKWQLNASIEEIEALFRKSIAAGEHRAFDTFVEWLDTQPNRASETRRVRQVGLSARGENLHLRRNSLYR